MNETEGLFLGPHFAGSWNDMLIRYYIEQIRNLINFIIGTVIWEGDNNSHFTTMDSVPSEARK